MNGKLIGKGVVSVHSLDIRTRPDRNPGSLLVRYEIARGGVLFSKAKPGSGRKASFDSSAQHLSRIIKSRGYVQGIWLESPSVLCVRFREQRALDKHADEIHRLIHWHYSLETEFSLRPREDVASTRAEIKALQTMMKRVVKGRVVYPKVKHIVSHLILKIRYGMRDLFGGNLPPHPRSRFPKEILSWLGSAERSIRELGRQENK